MVIHPGRHGVHAARHLREVAVYVYVVGVFRIPRRTTVRILASPSAPSAAAAAAAAAAAGVEYNIPAPSTNTSPVSTSNGDRAAAAAADAGSGRDRAGGGGTEGRSGQDGVRVRTAL